MIRRKCRKELKKRYGKVLTSLSEIDKIWKDYVKHGLVDELIHNGKVVVDKNFSIEVVGQPIVDNPKMYAIFSRGAGIKGNMVTKGANLQKGRTGVFYDIVLTDKNFKEGVLIFKPHPDISRAVHEALVNTNHHYRIK